MQQMMQEKESSSIAYYPVSSEKESKKVYGSD